MRDHCFCGREKRLSGVLNFQGNYGHKNRPGGRRDPIFVILMCLIELLLPKKSPAILHPDFYCPLPSLCFARGARNAHLLLYKAGGKGKKTHIPEKKVTILEAGEANIVFPVEAGFGGRHRSLEEIAWTAISVVLTPSLAHSPEHSIAAAQAQDRS